MPGAGSGDLLGVKYFNCAPGHGLFYPVSRLKRDDRFKDGDVETDETRSAEMQPTNTPHRQPQAETDQRRVLQSESLNPTSQEYSPAGRMQSSHSAGSIPSGISSDSSLFGLSSDQSTYYTLKELKTVKVVRVSFCVCDPGRVKHYVTIMIFSFFLWGGGGGGGLGAG